MGRDSLENHGVGSPFRVWGAYQTHGSTWIGWGRLRSRDRAIVSNSNLIFVS